MSTTYKTAKVIKEYRGTCMGREFMVPVGATVSNRTAMGYDDNYRFWDFDPDQVSTSEAHDLSHYGINVPKANCENYNW